MRRARSLVLDGVIALVEQSLLRQMPGADDEPRYQMFETVREFGLEQLAAAGEADEARQRHADYFLSIAENLQHGIRMTEDLTGLAPERDNVRLALTWFDEHGDADALLRLSVLLYGIWLAPGLYREGLQWIDRALNRSSTVASAPRVRALAAAGHLALFQWDYARAATYIAEGLALARELGDPLLVGGALHIAGLLVVPARRVWSGRSAARRGAVACCADWATVCRMRVETRASRSSSSGIPPWLRSSSTGRRGGIEEALAALSGGVGFSGGRSMR